MTDRLNIAFPVPADGAEKRYVNYFDAISALGARLTPVGADVAPGDYDGLLLPGGWDVNPERYGQANTACQEIDDALDGMQFGALDAFVKSGKPVLGICRGHQVVNVYFGGTLIQHLPQSATHMWQGDLDNAHGSHAAPGSVIDRIYGATPPVNSAHHQGVDRLGTGLRAIQWAEDGVIEAMAHEALPILCVQWHPERMCFRNARPDTVDGARVIERFLEMCKQT